PMDHDVQEGADAGAEGERREDDPRERVSHEPPSAAATTRTRYSPGRPPPSKGWPTRSTIPAGTSSSRERVPSRNPATGETRSDAPCSPWISSIEVGIDVRSRSSKRRRTGSWIGGKSGSLKCSESTPPGVTVS